MLLPKMCGTFMMIPLPAVATIEQRVFRYLHRHPEGVSGQQITAWLRSCKVDHTIADIERALIFLRNEGKISCTAHLLNGKTVHLWWLR